jgi:electron transfer flavoprotein beta subunit
VDVLVCVKRVPETGARITLTADEQSIDTTYLGFTISPHEECAVEEAIRIGGTTTVLTLGPAEAVAQLQDALAMGIESAILLETDGDDWGPEATAAAIADAVRDRSFDLLLFGNESADNGNYQVAIRVATALGLPWVTGIKGIEIADGVVRARREAGGGWDVFELPLPAVVSVREGINLPRYPSLPGRLRAKKAEIERLTPERRADGLEKVRLLVPQEEAKTVEILGDGPGAAPRVAELLRELGLVAS